MKKSIISILLVCLYSVLNGQTEVAEFYNFQDSIDRLTKELNATSDPKSKVNLLLNLSYYHTDYNKSLNLLNEASEITNQLNDSVLIAEIGLEKAMIFYMMGNFEESISYYKTHLPAYASMVDESSLNKINFQYAKALNRGARYYEALEIGLSTYEFFSSNPNNETYSGLLSKVIASVYKKLGRKQEAIQQYQTSIDWCEKDDNPSCVAGSYESLANIYLDLGDIEMANKMVVEAETTIKDRPELQWHSTYTNLIKAKIKTEEGDIEKALQILELNYKDVIEDQDQMQLANYHLAFSNAYIKNQAYQKALNHSAQALAIGNEKQVKSISKSAHYNNSIIFEKLGYTSKALEAYRNFNSINESILSTEKIAQINELDNKYKNAVKENKINKLEKENALNELKIERGKQKKVLLIASTFFLLFILGIVLFYLKRKSKLNALLKEKNDIISKSLSDKDVLLREIHHRVKNNLQVVSSLLNLQANYISDELALEAITEGKNRVSSMALIHQNLYREDNLTSIPSKEYFDDLILSLFESYNINEDNITLVKEIDDLDIDVDTMVPLGLIVNELVSNSLKHAFHKFQGKEKIIVKLKEENNILKLTIKDNGIGMSKDQFFSSDSFGNKMIKAFKQKLNADIIIENNNGTSVAIHIKNYKLIAA